MVAGRRWRNIEILARVCGGCGCVCGGEGWVLVAESGLPYSRERELEDRGAKGASLSMMRACRPLLVCFYFRSHMIAIECDPQETDLSFSYTGPYKSLLEYNCFIYLNREPPEIQTTPTLDPGHQCVSSSRLSLYFSSGSYTKKFQHSPEVFSLFSWSFTITNVYIANSLGSDSLQESILH